MQGNLQKTLEEAGLSGKEAKVYLTLLEQEATVAEISRQSGVNRATVYIVLNSLIKKGLVGTTPKPDQKTYYFASDPSSLFHTVQSVTKKQETVRDNLEQILPELKALHKDTRHRPKVRVYEGVEGVKEVYWDILLVKEAKDLKTYSNAGEIFKLFPNFMKHTEERIKKGIKMYAINPATKESIKLLSNLPANLPDEFSLIPEKTYEFPIDMAIYGDKVAFASPKKNLELL